MNRSVYITLNWKPINTVNLWYNTDEFKLTYKPETRGRKVKQLKSIRVVAAVIKRDDRIFATARGYGEYKGWWEFPGGKIENGETACSALVREIREELTAEIEVGDLIKTIEYDYPDFHLSMDCFWAEVTAGQLELKEAEDAKWLTSAELDDVKWLPADRELIECIKESFATMTGGMER